MTAVPASAGEGRFTGDDARLYDERIRVSVPGYDLMHQLVAAALRQHLGDMAHLLIVGAGTGAELLLLGQQPGWRFTAVDPAADMLEVARERCDEAVIGDRVTFHPAMIDQMPETPDFDGATAILVMHFLPDDGAKGRFLQDISDRLRPGATLVLADLHGDTSSEQFARLTGVWRTCLRNRGVPEENTTRMEQQVLANMHFVPEARLRELMTEAGFAEIDLIYRWLHFGAWSIRKAPDPVIG